MYYPKSQTKTDLYTQGGEYVFLGTNNIYSGSYFTTGDGKIFTGKNPNNKPNIPLEPVSINLNDFQPNNPELEEFPNTYDIIDDNYYWAKNMDINNTTPAPKPPIQILPTPNSNNYNIGEIQRYFASKINEIKYIEINEHQFSLFINKESTIQHTLYKVFQIPWVITGNRSSVYNVNLNTVNRTQKDFQLQGFKSYFKGKYDQLFKYTSQDNLYTGGDEFKSIVTGKMFKGYYHIHPKMGPMEGRQHTIEKHNILLPISGSNKKLNTSSPNTFGGY